MTTISVLIKMFKSLRINCDSQNKKDDIAFFKKSKKRLTHESLDELEKISIKDIKSEDLCLEYPFFNLRESKLEVTINRNNIRMSKEDGCNPIYYEGQLKKAEKQLKECEDEWLPIIKNNL